MATMGKHVYGEWKIKRTTREFCRTESGKSWRSKPYETRAEIINAEHYNNFVDSIPFFNGFLGGTCRGYYGYTFAGYVITSVTTINPARDTKYVDTFEFMG